MQQVIIKTNDDQAYYHIYAPQGREFRNQELKEVDSWRLVKLMENVPRTRK